MDIYDIFHDECKEDGYWHGFLFVPRSKQNQIFQLLQQTRENLNYFYPIHFSNVSQKAKTCYTKVRVVESWVSILMYAIQQQKIDATIYLGHKNRLPIYDRRHNKIGVHLAVLHLPQNHKDMYDDMPFVKRIETTFRMGLKGGAHFFFQKDITIGNIYIDYHKNVLIKKFSSKNILERFKNESNENIFFTKDSQIIPFSKDNYKQGYIISDFMQLADVAVSGMRTIKMQLIDFPARIYACRPFQSLLEKKSIYKRMENSRYFHGFTLSDAWIENGEWQFDNMKLINNNKKQEQLI
jgi:hypothetical protein